MDTYIICRDNTHVWSVVLFILMFVQFETIMENLDFRQRQSDFDFVLTVAGLITSLDRQEVVLLLITAYRSISA